MAHIWGQNETLLSINKTKKQAKQEAKIRQQLEDCKKAVQKAEQKLSAAQARLEADKTYLNNLTTKLEKRYQHSDLAQQLPQTQKPPDASQPEVSIDHAHPQENTAPLPQSGLYAYALVNANTRHLDLMGIDHQHKIFPVQKNGISVMVSEIHIEQFQNQVKRLFSELATSAGDTQEGTVNILQAHEQVIDTLMQDTTVVPLKFGTILKDTAAAMQMLRDQKAYFKDLLTKFRGKVEWGVKVYVDRQALTAHITHTEPRFATGQKQGEQVSRGRAYLQERKMTEDVKEYVDTRLSEITETIVQTLAKMAFETKLNATLSQRATGKKKEMILNAAYLIEKEHVHSFQQQQKSLIDAYKFIDLDIEFSGPWPPYNFT